jgi:hypothetical protein
MESPWSSLSPRVKVLGHEGDDGSERDLKLFLVQGCRCGDPYRFCSFKVVCGVELKDVVEL